MLELDKKSDGSLCESFVHSRYKWFNRKRGPRALLADATVHAVQRARRCSLTAETLASASWAMPEHASSMARPTADNILMVHDDEEVGVDERRCDAARTLQHAAHRRIVDRRTQYHPLSAAINNRASHGTNGGTGSIVQSAVAHAEHDSAPMC